MAPKANKNNLEAAMKNLTAALEQRYTDTQTVERGGDRIRIPERMSLTEAAQTIAELNARMEEVEQTQHVFDCHPNDGLVCFYRAMTEVFGELMGQGSADMFKGGNIPGRSVTIPISTEESITVPIGEAAVPGLPIKMTLATVPTKTDIGGALVVTFEAKRKYRPMIDQIVQITRNKLKTQSIYKGHAINSKFEFFNLKGFEPDKVIYSRADEKRINANILQPIRRTETWRKAGSRLKRGILLAGEYGTGKTLTAQLIAYECQKNGWTFINVAPGDPIANSLKLARLFAPAVVFYEDIDQETNTERSGELNQILNVVDGVVGKADEVMVILTTNHIDKINPAMMRPGRLDAAIMFVELDEYAIEKLIRTTGADMYGKSRIEGELNMTEIMDAATGYTAAFINESVVKAKAYALARTDSTDWSITSDDIVGALMELRPQYNMMRGNKVDQPLSLDSAMQKLVGDELGRLLVEKAPAVVEAAKKEA